MPDIQLPNPPDSWFRIHMGIASQQNITQYCKLKAIDRKAIRGSATIYNATGNLTASGNPYGSGIAIAPSLLDMFPYGTHIRISDITTGKSLTTYVVDTGNFGAGRKYVTAMYGERVIDLPINLANALDAMGTTEVQIEAI